jgi:Protein of unknown function (DUF559)/Transcriptional regulator, AbiEi antitoxin
MRANASVTRSEIAWRRARAQHWVLTRRDLLALGFSPKAIRRRVESGRLHPIGPGIYAVGRPELTREGWWMAAVLACGRGAALSHRSAGALWGIARERPGRIEVSCTSRRECERPGVRVRSGTLRPAEIVRHHRIPLTIPVRTMVDLATEAGPRLLERYVNEADKLDLADPEALRRELEGYRGVRGVRPLRNLLDRDTFVLTAEELERLFLPIAREVGLSLPQTGEMVNGFEVDFYWPERKLVVETDGLRYHRTPAAQARDALRDQAHTAAGFTRLRFTHHQVKHEPEHVRRILAETVAR